MACLDQIGGSLANQVNFLLYLGNLNERSCVPKLPTPNPIARHLKKFVHSLTYVNLEFLFSISINSVYISTLHAIFLMIYCCRIAMAKAAFKKKGALFTSTLDLEMRKKLVNCYTWSIALYGAETGTLRAVYQKHLESFEMWCWRRMEKISWTDHVRNEKGYLESMSRGISYMK